MSKSPKGGPDAKRGVKPRRPKTSTRKPPVITAQQERFCQEYLIDLNATQAALRANYADPSYGRHLLTIPHVSECIARLMQERAARTKVTADRVLEELADVAFTTFDELGAWDEDSLRFIPSAELPRSARRSVQAVKVKRTSRVSPDGAETNTVEMEIRQHDKLSALDKIAKHLGLYRPEEGTGRTSGLDALVELMAARKRQRDAERQEA